MDHLRQLVVLEELAAVDEVLMEATLEETEPFLSGIKMYAVIDNFTKEVVYHWLGEDKTLSDHDINKYSLIEMTPEN